MEKAKPYPFSYKRLIKESRPELPISLLGIVAACTNGTVMPIFAIIYSEIVTTFQKPDPRVCSSSYLFMAKSLTSSPYFRTYAKVLTFLRPCSSALQLEQA